MRLFLLATLLLTGVAVWAQPDLPVDFESTSIDYDLTDFGGAISSITADPQAATNTVAQTVKPVGAELWAGTTIGLNGFATPIPFASGSTQLSVRVWSPLAGIPVRLKVEDSTNPAISVETESTTAVASAWDTLTFDFSNQVSGTAAINLSNTYNKCSIFFNFGTTGTDAGELTFYWDDVAFVTGGAAIALPIDFELPAESYEFAGFEGAASAIEANPDPSGVNTSATIMRTTKTEGAAFFAGTFVSLDVPIDFSSDGGISMDVWSPKLDIPVRIRLENADNSSGVEVDVNTTVQNQWETLTYDFSSLLDPAVEYVRVVVFFEFVNGLPGDGTTYYFDNIQTVATQGSGAFCNDTVQHLGIPAETASAVNLTIENVDASSMIVSVSSANADPVDLLIVANGSGAAISPEDFSVPGQISRTLTWTTPPAEVVLNVLWSKESFAGNWQLSPEEISVPFAASCGGGGLQQVDLPVTFDEATVDYSLVDFGGAASAVVEDPTNPGNMVAQTLRTDAAETFAGTAVGPDGMATAIPFAAPLDTKISLRVWSPEAGIPVRMKVENASNAAISVETETTTTVAMDWDTLEFDFSANVAGTPLLDFNASYHRIIVFFNFGALGADVGAQTYFWDDIAFVSGPDLDQVDLPVTFEDENVNYALTDFGGNASQLVADPNGSTNTVAQSIKTDAAELWAGTTIGGVAGFANAIPFAPDATTMSVRVWSPQAGMPVRLKVENASDPTISVETEALTTTSLAWETLVFDFINEAPGTAALNLDNSYSKASIFFNFGTAGSDAGELTFYWDDVNFGAGSGNLTVYDIIAQSPDHNTLQTAIEQALLVDALNGAGPLTVFAPTDAAFDALDDGVLEGLLQDPTGDLQQVLLYHVVGADVPSASLVAGPVTTLQGQDVEVSFSGTDVLINDALVTVVDLTADNGRVHVIDAVLIPQGIIDGLTDISSTSHIAAWPIPVTTELNVSFAKPLINGAHLSIYDMSGRLVWQRSATGQLSRIQLAHLNDGQYILRIDAGGEGYYHRFAVIR